MVRLILYSQILTRFYLESQIIYLLVTEKKEQVWISYLISPHHSQSSSSAGIIYSLISVCEASQWGWFGSEKMLRLGNVIMVQNIDNQEVVVYHLLDGNIETNSG